MGAVGWASRGSPHGADVHARSIRGMSGTGGAEAVGEKSRTEAATGDISLRSFFGNGEGALAGRLRSG